MDDHARNDLLVALADARNREADARQRLQAHVAHIGQIRAELGNPYFFSGRPPDDPESAAHFTGYKSHEPAFAVWQQWQDISEQVAAILRQLQDGVEG